jgi:histone H3/H4
MRTKQIARKAPTNLRAPTRELQSVPQHSLGVLYGGTQKRSAAIKGKAKKLAPFATKRKRKPGVQALREIERHQQAVTHVIPRLPFRRLVVEILQDYQDGGPFRIAETALMALQAGAEDYVIQLMTMGHCITVHAGRVALQPKDMALAQKLSEWQNRNVGGGIVSSASAARACNKR